MNLKMFELAVQRSVNLSRVFESRLKYSLATNRFQQLVQFSSGSDKESLQKNSQGSLEESLKGSGDEMLEKSSEGSVEEISVKSSKENVKDRSEELKKLLKKSSPLKMSEKAEEYWATSSYSRGTVFYENLPPDEDDDSQRDAPKPEQTSIIMFPGQGNQFVGMAKNLLQYPMVKDMFDAASEILHYNLLKLCLDGPEEKLNQTEYCQPATLVCSLAALEKLKDEKPWAINNCVATCGFSLGEYASLVLAGCMNFERAVQLVKLRAELMQTCCEIVPSGMVTILYGHQSKISEAIRDANEHTKSKGINVPECSVANYLFPGCKIYAGHIEALNYIIENYKKYKIFKVSKLSVSGAFHTPLMLQAAHIFEEEIKNVKFSDPLVTVYSNITGRPYQNAADIKKKLPQQIFKPVKWEQILHNVYQRPQGQKFPFTYECGPGTSLSVILSKVNLQAWKSCSSVKL